MLILSDVSSLGHDRGVPFANILFTTTSFLESWEVGLGFINSG